MINPGGTSTKIAVFEDGNAVFKKTIDHPAQELCKYPKVFDQREFRTNLIIKSLETEKCRVEELAAVIGRGGIVKPILGGVYQVNKALMEDMRRAVYGEHASNLGAVIAKDIADKAGIPSFIMDPVSVDEMQPVAKLSGMKELPRIALQHTLNSRAVARLIAEEMGQKYEELRLIVVHLGAGISVTPHLNGKIIDCNNALEGGPFSADRAGYLPSRSLVKLCYSGKYSTSDELIKKINSAGGLFDHLGSKDLRDVEKMVAEGDTYAKLVLDAMIYQIAKEIGAMATVLLGKVDYIILTGGMAFSNELVKGITNRVGFIGKILVRPGEKEMEALAQGAYRAIRGEEAIKIYQ